MRCPSCSFEIAVGARFCGRCGAALPIACAACGAANSSGNRFCEQCGIELLAAPAPVGTVSDDADAERRQLTILFCDLVGSTELSQRVDPEQLRDILAVYRDAVAETVHSFDGVVARYLGDGVMAYFGYPVAREDDAYRAVMAARKIVSVMADVSARKGDVTGGPLRVRVGVHTGLVVAGELRTGSSHESMSVVGEAPNVAARLHEIAPPDGIVVGPLTARLVRQRVPMRAAGPRPLKGIDLPVDVHLVTEREGDTPFVAVAGPMVGRESELSQLWDRWRQTDDGRGQAALISGEPGIGKSRLMAALRERIGDAAAWVDCAASSLTEGSALAPFIDFFRRRVAAAGTGEQAISAVLAEGNVTATEARSLFVELLGQAEPGAGGLADWTALRKRRRTLQLLAAWLLGQAARRPVVLAVEDIHWLDASSRELIELLRPQLHGRRVLLLMTARPEVGIGWIEMADVAVVQLGPLPAPSAEAIVQRVAAGRTLPRETIGAILRKTDGIPLFVEELTRAMIEVDALELGGERAEARPAEGGVPATLRDSLMARLDRLSPAKTLAQIGSVVGRTFSFDVMHALSELELETLEAGLSLLVTNGILHQQGFPPEATYAFKHALIHDVAYESLLLSRRQKFHRRLARHYLATERPLVESRPELVAVHFAAAGQVTEAVEYFARAGRVAAARSANIEARGHLSEALRLAKGLADAAARDDRELDLEIELGAVNQAIRGYAGDAAQQSFERALSLCRRRGEGGRRLFSALWGLSGLHLVKGPLGTARKLVEELLEVARTEGDPVRHIESQRRLGWVLFLQGDMAGARRELAEKTFALIDAARGPLPTLYGSHPLAGALSNRALLEWYLGSPDSAIATAERALQAAAVVGSPFSVAYSLGLAGVVYQLGGRVDRVRRLASALERLSQEQEFPYWEAWGRLLGGWADAVEGDFAGGVEAITGALERYLATGARQLQPYAAALLAELQLGAGAFDAARATLDSVPIDDPDYFQYHAPELLRLRGELESRAGGSAAAAEAFHEKALLRALGQGALEPAMRAAAGLCRLGVDGREPYLAAMQELAGRLPPGVSHEGWSLGAGSVAERRGG